jgi:hypothetical protein
MITIVVGLL